MAAIVEDRHPLLVFLEDPVDVVERGVDHELGLAERPGPLQTFPQQLLLPGQAGQVALRSILIGEGQDDHRQVGHAVHPSRPSGPDLQPASPSK